MQDIVICSVPYSYLNYIYSAPAILKGVLLQNGYSARTADFGIKLYKMCDRDKVKFAKVQNYFVNDDLISNDVENFYASCIDYFKQNPSKYIGLCVWSVFAHKAVYDLCERIKKAGIESKIIIGGRGCKVKPFANVSQYLELKPTEKILSFGDFLKKRKLIDECVIGDGEDAILAIVSGKEYVPDPNSESFKYPVPDYADYNFEEYFIDDELMLPITGSKGCVRDCDFCDIKFQFGKYRYRTGQDIANEMITISKQYGIKKFQFTDSLVNGGLKPFMEFLEILSKYNLENPSQKIRWNGQYICRLENQIPKNYYKLMQQSGAHGMNIGAESGSNQVLKSINKKTTVEALYTELEQFRQHGITCTLLTFVGHWSETWEDFKQTCQMLLVCARYVRSGTISAISLGLPMMMLDGTPAFDNMQENHVEASVFDDNNIWINIKNSENTFRERVLRRLIVFEICKKLNIPTTLDYENFSYLKSVIDTHYVKINQYYEDQLANCITEH